MEPKQPSISNSKEFGEVCLRKERRKRQKLLITELLYDYAKNSTLHGLRYIVERTLHSIEKCFWLLTFVMSLGMCFYLISNVWYKWKTSPVIVSFSERVVPVGDVPFPSITICPQLKNKATIYNFTEAYSNSASGDRNQSLKLDHVAFVCSKQLLFEDFTDQNITDSSFVNDLFEVAPTVSDVFLQCSWRGRDIDCEDNFKSVLTREGVCYNFNALAASEILRLENVQNDYVLLNTSRPSMNWSMSKDYNDFITTETYPRRGRENNADPDLSVILNESPADHDALCNSLKSGYTIYVQHPADLPQASLYYYAALSSQVSSLALKFNKVMTANSLKGYSPEERQCYFPNDKYLRYFKIYTANNCRLECQSNYTFKICGCVWFHMPHSDSRQICLSISKIKCMKRAFDELSIAEIKSRVDVGGVSPCSCLPSCNSVQYDAEILKTTFNVHKFIEAQEKMYGIDLPEITEKNYSLIEVYFKEPRFVSMRRSELFGLTDFMANCGGLLGLFLGFSFLSLVEIFYFITIRLFYILRRDLKEEKKSKIEVKAEVIENEKF